jgi:hypothetical protein
MKADILYYENEWDNKYKVCDELNLVRDLKIDILLDAMAGKDIYLRNLCKKILLNPSRNGNEIQMRQEVLKDALNFGKFFMSMYELSVECLNKVNEYKDLIHPRYDKIVTVVKKTTLQYEIAKIYLSRLEQLKNLIPKIVSSLESARLTQLCNDIRTEYSDEFFHDSRSVMKDLSYLKSDMELVVCGHIGLGLKLDDVNLNEMSTVEIPRFRISKRIQDSDAVVMLDNLVLHNNAQEIIDAGLLQLLKELNKFNSERSIFFEKICEMFGFYVGAINLHQILMEKNCKLCFPSFLKELNSSYIHLSDIVLHLTSSSCVVDNSHNLTGKKLCIVTGPNQGGKTTFLRSIGLAQLMAQSGLFVAADFMECNIYSGIYSHFSDYEDGKLESGLLDQELQKMNELIKKMKSGSLLLMNETFSTTSEFDAGYLAGQIVPALCESDITILFVTHLYEYVRELYEREESDHLFLRAVRALDGSRSYRIEEGEPLRSCDAIDLYRDVMG